ncbi:probable Bax inhibitor 1 [Anneissia japonica]|uniref:probable Bax inhibitor 1 n=1 Tax=Anneissia japonica TaxID=1529436 RepID=UPI001425BA55|nr:probable Bax inhibitor 1 [Anneissia japonica]
MDSLFRTPKISLKTLTDFSQIDKSTQAHLRKVYTCLGIAMMAAATGAYVHLFTGLWKGGLLTSIASIGILIWLAMTPKENEGKRIGQLSAFALCTGMSLGPLLNAVINIDPSIVVTALMGTVVIFVSLSLCALYTQQRYWLFIGGSLMSMLSMMLVLSILNLFLRSAIIFRFEMYFGLFVFCGFVLFDTQLIIEKKRNGDNDFVWHSVDLFLDFINIFRHLLVILADKNDKRKK